MVSAVDTVIVVLTIALPLLYFYRESIPFIGGKVKSTIIGNGHANGSANGNGNGKAIKEDEGDPRDFVAKMEKANKRCVMFYGSQTGTAEEYAVRLAKEAKSRFGISSLVCDPEEYDFNTLDTIPSSKVVFFVVATYGEGEPTDNAQPLWEFLMDEDVMFSLSKEGKERLENLRYVVFGLGNRTYEHFNEVGRKIDKRLEELGAKRIGTCGEGDDDKSMEEDYLAWKDTMWESFQKELGVEEGGSGDVADFVVTEIDTTSFPLSKIYHGELSSRALTGTKGTHDLKNPFLSPVIAARELFSVDAQRNCVHVEFDISGSGMSYQHGDHVGVWPSNPDIEVDRMLSVLGLASPERRQAAVRIESLDPTLAKVPFPSPATYDAIFRHYLDISAIASRQTVAMLANFAPTPEIARKLARWGSDKEVYSEEVAKPALKLAEVLQAVWGNDLNTVPSSSNTTVWSIPFDRIISSIPRLQPRYYSISSSSKLFPDTIHITAVVLKYESGKSISHGGKPRYVYGVGTNFILNVKMAQEGNKVAPTLTQPGQDTPNHVSSGIGPSFENNPTYRLDGPRGSHLKDTKYFVPIHVRRSTFRLPTSPKVPIIMIGPGTGVAPFRGFVQDRVAAARRAISKAGAGSTPESALVDWADMYLFYGCRSEKDDYLYRDEWVDYRKELGGKLHLEVAFSRGQARKPDGGKIYVQDLLWNLRKELSALILEKRAYVYICGDAKGMAKAVEEKLMQMLGEAKGGSAEVEGAKELKMLKERNRLLLDVWS